MADEEHLQILKQGVETWNDWRAKHRSAEPLFRGPDLRGAYLRDAELSKANLSFADLNNADLIHARLSQADLHGACLSGATLNMADLSFANLVGVDFRGAELIRVHLRNSRLSFANFHRANLRSATLEYADLDGTNLIDADLGGALLRKASLAGAQLSGADFSLALIDGTIFADVDLRDIKGLATVIHQGPSDISISTVYRSAGNIPETFLRGCGVPESFIIQIPALVAAMQPIQFYSCFISYSSNDDEFARRLHSRMRQAELRVWFAPEDIKGGDKIYDQIDHAIQVHDRLLLVLSENSLQSKWVETEIRRARKVEMKERRRKLFPIRLTSYEALQQWVCIDSTTGEDLAEEVRSYFIPDFSNWKGQDDFERAFARLYEDLKASAGQ